MYEHKIGPTKTGAGKRSGFNPLWEVFKNYILARPSLYVSHLHTLNVNIVSDPPLHHPLGVKVGLLDVLQHLTKRERPPWAALPLPLRHLPWEVVHAPASYRTSPGHSPVEHRCPRLAPSWNSVSVVFKRYQFVQSGSLSPLGFFPQLGNPPRWGTSEEETASKYFWCQQSSQAPGRGGQAGLHLQLAIPPLEWRWPLQGRRGLMFRDWIFNAQGKRPGRKLSG